jgi:DnaJ like chaperone protein
MGHLCKADGRVSEAEIAMASKVMQRMALNQTQRRRAMEQFRAGKEPAFVLGDTLTKLRNDCGKAPMLLHMFVDVQLSAALADGDLTPQEDTTLRFICVRLGIPAPIYEQSLNAARIEAGLRGGAGGQRGVAKSMNEDDYAVLGVSANAADAEIKQAYRRLISQHHPDKLAAEGVSAEMLRLANEKTLRVRQAYERIQSMRGAA